MRNLSAIILGLGLGLTGCSQSNLPTISEQLHIYEQKMSARTQEPKKTPKTQHMDFYSLPMPSSENAFNLNLKREIKPKYFKMTLNSAQANMKRAHELSEHWNGWVNKISSDNLDFPDLRKVSRDGLLTYGTYTFQYRWNDIFPDSDLGPNTDEATFNFGLTHRAVNGVWEGKVIPHIVPIPFDVRTYAKGSYARIFAECEYPFFVSDKCKMTLGVGGGIYWIDIRQNISVKAMGIPVSSWKWKLQDVGVVGQVNLNAYFNLHEYNTAFPENVSLVAGIGAEIAASPHLNYDATNLNAFVGIQIGLD